MNKEEMFKIKMQIFGEEGDSETTNPEHNESETQDKDSNMSIDDKLKQFEEKYKSMYEAKEKDLIKTYKEKESKLEKRLKQIEDLSLDTKQKEDLAKLDEKEKKLEQDNSLLQRLEEMEKEMAKKEHKIIVKDYVSKNPYLEGHIEHTNSKEELDSLIKREGENWKRLFEFENDKNKNRNAFRGYKHKPTNADENTLNEKKNKYKERFSKFLPHKVK